MSWPRGVIVSKLRNDSIVAHTDFCLKEYFITMISI